MRAYDVKCPLCGKINYNLYLEETGGWMECENCHRLAKTFYPSDKEGKIISSPADNTDRVAMLCEAGC